MKYLLGLATSLTLTMNGTNAILANDLMDGIHPFLCNEESFVMIEDSNTWSVANSNLEVLTTDNGWRFEDRDEGDVGYLTETRDGAWELNWLSSYGPEKWDCIDLLSATDQVVETIKPKIDENILNVQKDILKIQKELEETRGALEGALANWGSLKKSNKELSNEIQQLVDEKTKLGDKLVEQVNMAREDLGKRIEAENKIVSLTEKNESLIKDIAIRESQAKYYRDKLNETNTQLTSANGTIKDLKFKVSSGVSLVEYTREQVKELAKELDDSKNALKVASVKFNRIVSDPKVLVFLEQLQEMTPSERNASMANSKFGGAALVRNGMLGRCIATLRDKAILADDCKVMLADFLVDPNSN